MRYTVALAVCTPPQMTAASVDHEVVAAAGHLEVAALHRRVRADDVGRRDLAGDDVVGEDRRQRGGVGLEGLDRGRVDLRERVVDRCEDGELVTVERVDEVDLGVELCRSPRR